jgi:hypothetical protein
MNNPTFVSPRRFRLGAALAVAVLALVACGSDDATPEVPEGGTGSAYNDAIIASESHDEVLLNGGDGEILVAVDCDPDEGATIVTVVADGLAPGTYTGTFEPSTGVDLTLDVTQDGQSTTTAEMTLDADEYTVTFADVEGGEFSLRGCQS